MTKDETQKEEHGDRAQIQGQVREREREGERHDRQEGTPSRKQRDQTKGAGTKTDNT